MSKRINHATRALQLSQSEYSDPRTDTAVAIQTEALVHATLALVEQQRIANLIALEDQRWARVSQVGNYFGPDVLRGNPADPGSTAPLRPEIAAALGINQGEIDD